MSEGLVFAEQIGTTPEDCLGPSDCDIPIDHAARSQRGIAATGPTSVLIETIVISP